MSDLRIGRHTILIGDVRERLRDLPDESVHMCVTSPPYFGLRDYGTATWDGGDPACDHKVRKDPRIESSTLGGGKGTTGHQQEGFGHVCGRCGATRVDNQIGLEPTLAEFIATMVDVFREVRRVLRPDGTCWINLGDSFFSGGSNAIRSRPVRREPPYDKCGIERQGSRLLGSAYPRLCDGCRDALSRRTSGSDRQHHEFSSPHGQTTRDNEHRDSFSATLDGVPLVALESTSRESSQPPPGECWHCDNCGACLSVLGSSSRDARLCARMAACTSGNEWPASGLHNQDTDASGLALAEPPNVQPEYTMNLKPKDLMMVPARLAIALQDDGWWLRSDIIWAKKAPMPESVTDRPTSAHEHIFLLAKQPRYYYDADAVREPWESGRDDMRTKGVRTGLGYLGSSIDNSRKDAEFGDGARVNGESPLGRNQRNVWTLGPEPFPEAHFATFPTEIPRRAIKAGTSERGCCSACGAPWVRQTEKTVQFGSGSGKAGNQPNGKYQGAAQAESGRYDIRMGPQVQSVTTGWAPSCACEADVIPATCLDPFLGSGTTMLVADQLGRTCVGVELSPEYAAMSEKRVRSDAPLLAGVA